MEQLDVKILGRDFRLAVSDENRARLLEAARVVDQRMQSIRDGGRAGGLERIAVMAALQLADELIAVQGTSGAGVSPKARERLRRMGDDIDAELRRQESLF